MKLKTIRNILYSVILLMKKHLFYFEKHTQDVTVINLTECQKTFKLVFYILEDHQN